MLSESQQTDRRGVSYSTPSSSDEQPGLIPVEGEFDHVRAQDRHEPGSDSSSISSSEDDDDRHDIFSEEDGLSPPSSGRNSPTSSTSQHSIIQHCDACPKTSKNSDLYWCNLCGITVCDGCWEQQFAHKPSPNQRPGARERPSHEKTDLRLQDMIDDLKPKNDKESIKEHASAVRSKWFGVNIDKNGPPSLVPTSRYEDLAMGFARDKYPALVRYLLSTCTIPCYRFLIFDQALLEILGQVNRP